MPTIIGLPALVVIIASMIVGWILMSLAMIASGPTGSNVREEGKGYCFVSTAFLIIFLIVCGIVSLL